MPELPEVETIRRNLCFGFEGNPSIIDLQILAAYVYWPRTLETPTLEEFNTRVIKQSITDISRRGKFLIFQLSTDYLLFHLRMSGDMQVENTDSPLDPHHRVVFDLENKIRLSFNDTRKFGRVWLVNNPLEVTKNLGPEPLDPDFSPQNFFDILKSRRRQLKPLLMDQSFLAGLGNIYSDEALYLAKLHPLVNSHDITPSQSRALWTAIQQVLEEGIQHNGASIDWVYRGGGYQNHFRIYQRNGESCPTCGTLIERIVVGQRSTHLCPKCQPDPAI